MLEPKAAESSMRRLSVQPTTDRDARRNSIIEYLALSSDERRRCSLAGEVPSELALLRRISLLASYGLPSVGVPFVNGFERRNSLSNEHEHPITILPLEVVLLIFGFLDAGPLSRLREVSSYWKFLADDELLWRDLCDRTFGADMPIANFPTYRDAYIYHQRILGRTTFWAGMSKWQEPEGFDFAQETQVHITFEPGSNVITGKGITVNYSIPNPFDIVGRRISFSKFYWEKKFVKHVSKYSGEIDFDNSSLKGEIEYHDGTYHWKGIFHYSLASLATPDRFAEYGAAPRVAES
eukprot:TRINITY_DN11280_c0_g1_i1.p1 TRINITY_DN11280_c0_g1~~TRINITY_DN11280_c0_g1_i1.p1  ORF type:complete len:294 (-),score=72.85 TRINITY_DN11280_c0_g1_i1:161-1042(-)